MPTFLGLFRKGTNYAVAAANAKIDEKADPKIQIQQAIELAQHQHGSLTQQAAVVIGNQHQLEMKLNRQFTEVERLQASIRQALTLADEARGRGDEGKAHDYEAAAETFASQLIVGEQNLEDLKTLHEQAMQAAAQAKQAVDRNATSLQQKLAERTKLLSQLDQAKMQETVSASLNSMSELAAPGSTPSLDAVREKIEGRYAAALGAADLAQNSVQGRMLEVQHSSTQLAGRSRLEQIRASMGQSTSPTLTAGDPSSASIQEATPQNTAGSQPTT